MGNGPAQKQTEAKKTDYLIAKAAPTCIRSVAAWSMEHGAWGIGEAAYLGHFMLRLSTPG